MKHSVLRWCAAILVLLSACGGTRPSRIPIEKNLRQKPSGAFQCPVKAPQILSNFGPRGKRYHTGIDLRAASSNKTVYAARAGQVINVTRLSGYGNIIIIKHSDGFTSRYAHLKKFSVKKGQKVKTGQAIGIVGQTGRASTPHLHFEILTPQLKFTDPKPHIFPS